MFFRVSELQSTYFKIVTSLEIRSQLLPKFSCISILVKIRILEGSLVTILIYFYREFISVNTKLV